MITIIFNCKILVCLMVEWHVVVAIMFLVLQYTNLTFLITCYFLFYFRFIFDSGTTDDLIEYSKRYIHGYIIFTLNEHWAQIKYHHINTIVFNIRTGSYNLILFPVKNYTTPLILTFYSFVVLLNVFTMCIVNGFTNLIIFND